MNSEDNRPTVGNFSLEVEFEENRMRLDKYLASKFPEFSRNGPLHAMNGCVGN